MPDGTLLAIAGSRLSATVSTEGAELSTLVDARAGDLLSDGDPRFWTGRAPLLFPIVGRLADDALRVGGRTYTLPQHGFARRRRFSVVEHGPEAVTLRLSDDPGTLAVFPFPFRLDARFAIEGDVLEMSMRVENTGAEPLPLAFGFHPAFRWPLPYGGAREAHEIEFEADEDAPIRRPYADGLLTPPAPTPVAGRRLALSDER